MLLSELVTVSHEVAATRSRTRKIAALAAALGQLEADEVEVGVAYLSGEPRQDRLDLGPAAVYGEEVPPAAMATLTLGDVDATLQAIADVRPGSGSRARRLELFDDLLGRATADEQAWLRALVLRELRQGALAGVLTQALSHAAGVPEPPIRRAAMLSGDLRATAVAALAGGEEALAAFRLEVGTPVQPMLATTAADVAAALRDLPAVVVEAKLDGARVQIHRDGDDVAVFTRNLHDVTGRVPEVVAAAAALPAHRVILDGEAITFDDAGRPRPFQDTMQRFGRELPEGDDGSDRQRPRSTEQDANDPPAGMPVEVRLFDLLHLDGEDLLDRPLSERLAALHRTVPASLRVPQTVASDAEEVRAFLHTSLADGHEGVMVKDLRAPYEAGRRGAAWRKLKPVHTLDLVVLAAEWGSGRRRGWLSNLHLGCYDPDAGAFVMLGKTFKGLTDETLTWQTEELLARELRRERHVVHVRPELVVEIAFDGLVRSPRYPGGLALRFARVRGYRPDRDARDADTIATVRAIHVGERLPTV